MNSTPIRRCCPHTFCGAQKPLTAGLRLVQILLSTRRSLSLPELCTKEQQDLKDFKPMQGQTSSFHLILANPPYSAEKAERLKNYQEQSESGKPLGSQPSRSYTPGILQNDSARVFWRTCYIEQSARLDARTDGGIDVRIACLLPDLWTRNSDIFSGFAWKAREPETSNWPTWSFWLKLSNSVQPFHCCVWSAFSEAPRCVCFGFCCLRQ